MFQAVCLQRSGNGRERPPLRQPARPRAIKTGNSVPKGVLWRRESPALCKRAGPWGPSQPQHGTATRPTRPPRRLSAAQEGPAQHCPTPGHSGGRGGGEGPRELPGGEREARGLEAKWGHVAGGPRRTYPACTLDASLTLCRRWTQAHPDSAPAPSSSGRVTLGRFLTFLSTSASRVTWESDSSYQGRALRTDEGTVPAALGSHKC